jgi:RNase P subunit RPR2
MKNKLNRQEAEKEINEIFSKNPNKEQIRKAKKLAMSKNIKLGNLKKKFCKKCFSLFNPKNSSVRIKKGFKILKCKNCSYLSRHRLK